MPIYTYHCNRCDEEYDLLVSYDDRDNEKDCMKCLYTNTITRIPSWSGGFRSDVPPRLDSDFKQVMKKIKRASGRKNTIPDY